MKARLFIATLAAAIGAWLAISALAHGDEHSNDAAERQREDHTAALGKPGDSHKVSRTIEIDMSDAMRFSPANVTVKHGETIRFVVRNTGKVKHEMVLGTLNELKAHAKLMGKFPNMEHADPNMVSVDPGKTGELI